MLSTIIIMAILCSVHHCIFSFQNIAVFHLSFVFHQTKAKFLNFLKLPSYEMNQSLQTIYAVWQHSEVGSQNSLSMQCLHIYSQKRSWSRKYYDTKNKGKSVMTWPPSMSRAKF